MNELTIGVMGTGYTGAEVCRLANAFNMRILAYDTNENEAIVKNYNVKYTSKDELIKNSNIITLHLPNEECNKNIIARKEFADMKADTYIINTSGNNLINTEDLYSALVKKNIAGAALDVSEGEEIMLTAKQLTTQIKKISQELLAKLIFTRMIAQMPNVIVTSHVAYNTQDSINNILQTTFNSIQDCLQGKHTNQIN